ncbi:MAG: hypothetical protein ACKO5K_17460 [Armatimonadota bacterium]
MNSMIASAALNRTLSAAATVAILSSLAFAVSPDIPADGRPAAPVPGHPDRHYERRILRRSGPLDPAVGSEQWFPLMEPLEGQPDLRAMWDGDGLAFSVRTFDGGPVVLDVDREGDGFERRAANYRVHWSNAGAMPIVRRWDHGQSGRAGAWAKVDPAAVRCLVSGDRLIVVLPGKLPARKNGGDVGVRLGRPSGDSFAVPPESNGFMVAEMVDEIPAAGLGLAVRLTPFAKVVTDPGNLRAAVEIANVSGGEVEVRSWSLEGPAGAGDGSSGEIRITPGAKLRREITIVVPEGDGARSLAYQLILTTKAGRLVARAAVERIDPCVIELRADDSPVVANAPDARRQRIVQVVLRSQSDKTVEARVSLSPPAGWVVDGSERTVRLSYATEVKGASFKVTPPLGCPPGRYPVEGIVSVAGRTRHVSGAIVVSGQ